MAPAKKSIDIRRQYSYKIIQQIIKTLTLPAQTKPSTKWNKNTYACVTNDSKAQYAMIAHSATTAYNV